MGRGDVCLLTLAHGQLNREEQCPSSNNLTERLKVRQKQPKRGRLWLVDGSCVRRRPEYRHHVWAYDFVAERTSTAGR